MQTSEESALYLRWLLAWLRDLLALGDDLISWGSPDFLCIHVEFHEQLLDAACHVVSMLCIFDGARENSAQSLLLRDPGFPSSLPRRKGVPGRGAITKELLTLLHRFDLAMDDRGRNWPVSWRILHRKIDAICGWSPP
jgi:hypothetical protein